MGAIPFYKMAPFCRRKGAISYHKRAPFLIKAFLGVYPPVSYFLDFNNWIVMKFLFRLVFPNKGRGRDYLVWSFPPLRVIDSGCKGRVFADLQQIN